jgi:hypothetical protein
MEQDILTHTLIMVKQKVFIESIIVTPKNAMLLVLIIKLLHLGGYKRYYLKEKDPRG